MSLKEEFIEQFESKFTLSNIRDHLIKASELYYNTDERLMSDSFYDRLREFYEKKSGEKLPVGAKVTIGTTLDLHHSYTEFAGTLSKCKNIKDFQEWCRVKKVEDDMMVISIKADGHSITVEWVYDAKEKALVLDKALTRGENGVGKDLTALFKANLGRVPKPNVKFDVAVGYEAIITYDNFEELAEKTKYKNPRSAIGGIFSESGKEYFPFITLVPIRLKAKDDKNFLKRSKQLSIIEEMDNGELLDFQVVDKDDVEALYNEHEENRLSNGNRVNFMYDGLVVETLDEGSRKRLGYSSSEPNFATAIKFTPVEALTEVEKVEWSVEGFSSIYTPVVHFKPVVIRGNTYTKVSLANHGRFQSMKLKVGSPLIFALRNDTLGYVEGVKTEKPIKGPLLEAPLNCTSCGADLKQTKNGIFLYCPNNVCEYNRVGDIYNFVTKIGIKNVGLETLRALYRAKILFSVQDIMDLENKRSKIEKLEGFGKTSADNIIKEVDKVLGSEVKDYELLGSVNIPLVSRSRAKMILEYVTLDELLEIARLPASNKADEVRDKVIGIPGIGDEISRQLCGGMRFDGGYYILGLLDNGLKYTNTKKEREAGFKQLSFCHTGSASPLKDRDTIKNLLEDHGHKLVSGVSKKTDYLINNDTESTTVKNAKAKELGVPIISVKELMEMFN